MNDQQLKYPNKSHRRFNRDDIQMIVEMYNSDMTAQQIADMMNANQKTILNVLHRENVTRSASESKTIKLPLGEIVNLYSNEKWSASKIGKKYGVDTHTILNRLRSLNIKIVKNRRPKIHNIDMNELIRLYSLKISSNDIAKIMNVSESVILRNLHETNINVRPANRPQWKPLPIKTIIKYYKDGLSAQLIAKKYNCDTQHVLNKLHENGVETKRTGLGRVCATKAGETVRSSLEMVVADWLYSHQIEYQYEPKLENSRYKADFKINDTFVEVCGIENNLFNYATRLEQKIQFYIDNNLKYILLYPPDINDRKLTETLNVN